MTQITIDRGNGIELMEESDLAGPYIRVIENDNFKQTATLYHLNGRVVHEGCHIEFKAGAFMQAESGGFA